MDKKDITEITPHREIQYQEIGNISPKTKEVVTRTIKEVFKKKKFIGEPPEIVSISQGAVILPSGEEIVACYDCDTKDNNVPGRILVSAEKAKKSFGRVNIPIEIATAAFVAHEAVEHVNHMRGVKLLNNTSIIPTNVHRDSATEQEANSIAREVISNLYNHTVYFGDEKPPFPFNLMK